MRTIFLADAHLDNPEAGEYRLLLEFLRRLRGEAEALFILGDLFDFWLGFPRNPFHRYDDIIRALAELVEAGCRLVYFEGNHDFHLGQVFTGTLRAEVFTGPATITLQGRRYLFCHGDEINRKDYGYRLLRLLLHSRLTGAALRVVPYSLAERVRDRLQKTSCAGYEAKARRWDYPDLIRNYARQLRGEGYDGLVTGHFHLPLCEQLDGGPFRLLSLGAWPDRFTYGELVDGIPQPRHFTP